MKASSACFDLIREFESCRLQAYRDCVGKLTVGYGHTKGVHEGMVIDHAQADDFLKEDVADVEKPLGVLLEKIRVTQGQWDALVSFCFNLGVGAFKVSTLRGMLKARDIQGAANQFERWVYAGGKKKLDGLIRRRAAEKKLFLSGQVA